MADAPTTVQEQRAKIGSCIPCPECNANSCVLETRPNRDGLRRRRSCIACHYRFTTQETVVMSHVA